MRLFVLLLLMFSVRLYALDKTLTVAVNDGAPWAYYDNTTGVTGIDVEIIRQIFQTLGYQTEFHLLGYNRLIKEFNDGKFDVASPAAFASDSGHFTAHYLPFQDVAVSLKHKSLKIEQISDLHNKKIVAYQFASSVLGPEFANSVKQANYIEIAERELQLKLLVNHRADVVIGERRLLSYITQQHFPDIELAIHPIFVTQSYGAIVKDRQLQQLFDQQLIKMQASGELQRILQQWP